jgi:hypothetical protein
MSNTTCTAGTYSYAMLWDTCTRLNNGTAWVADYRLLAEGHINVSEQDHYVPNPYSVRR